METLSCGRGFERAPGSGTVVGLFTAPRLASEAPRAFAGLAPGRLELPYVDLPIRSRSASCLIRMHGSESSIGASARLPWSKSFRAAKAPIADFKDRHAPRRRGEGDPCHLRPGGSARRYAAFDRTDGHARDTRSAGWCAPARQPDRSDPGWKPRDLYSPFPNGVDPKTWSRWAATIST